MTYTGAKIGVGSPSSGTAVRIDQGLKQIEWCFRLGSGKVFCDASYNTYLEHCQTGNQQ